MYICIYTETHLICGYCIWYIHIYIRVGNMNSTFWRPCRSTNNWMRRVCMYNDAQNLSSNWSMFVDIENGVQQKKIVQKWQLTNPIHIGVVEQFFAFGAVYAHKTIQQGCPTCTCIYIYICVCLYIYIYIYLYILWNYARWRKRGALLDIYKYIIPPPHPPPNPHSSAKLGSGIIKREIIRAFWGGRRGRGCRQKLPPLTQANGFPSW